jgi:carnosine N-methyltransferase
MGPLLYHYEDLEGELSIELTLEEVYKVIESFQDFKIRLKQFKTCQYTSNQPSTSETISMYNYEYNCAFFIVAKNQ